MQIYAENVVSNISKQQPADKLDLGASEQQCMFFVMSQKKTAPKQTAITQKLEHKEKGCAK